MVSRSITIAIAGRPFLGQKRPLSGVHKPVRSDRNGVDGRSVPLGRILASPVLIGGSETAAIHPALAIRRRRAPISHWGDSFDCPEADVMFLTIDGPILAARDTVLAVGERLGSPCVCDSQPDIGWSQWVKGASRTGTCRRRLEGRARPGGTGPGGRRGGIPRCESRRHSRRNGCCASRSRACALSRL